MLEGPPPAILNNKMPESADFVHLFRVSSGVSPLPTYGTMTKNSLAFLRGKEPKLMYCFLLSALLIASAPMQTPSATATKPPSTTVKSAAASTTTTAQSPAAAKNAKPAVLAASDAVITIHGLCSGSQAGQNESCTTVVTKKQFDVLVDALSALGPPLLPAQRRGVAEAYATTLRNYEAAKKAGIEKDPRYAEVIRIAQMRAMGDMYNALLQEKAKKVSPQEIEDYYNANLPRFEELILRRVTVPRRNTANLNDEEFTARARKIAGEMHERAVKGEEMDVIQKDAFSALGVKDPPSTHMAVVRRGIYAADQEKQLFELKPGEVTGIFEQPSAFIVFKLEGRETPSLEKSKDEIVRILVQQHQEKLEQARDKSVQVDYNEQYLGPAQTSAFMPPSQSNAAPGHNQ